jgi:predicted tellurium resistance membrane protein TerC
MHWFGIALLALVLGYINAFISPLISSALPASAQQNKIVATFINGGIILAAVFIAVFILSAIGVKTSEKMS